MEQKTPRPPEDGSGKESGRGKPGKNEIGAWKLLGLGLQLGLTVALFAWAGKWLQGRYGWPDWTVVVFASVGVVAGLYYFVKETLR